MRRIYLDHAATTPLHPKAREAMAPWLGKDEGRRSKVEGRRTKGEGAEGREKAEGRRSKGEGTEGREKDEGRYGNPSSLHAEGRLARQALDEAREVLSSEFGCLFAEVVFASGGTESANLAILGAALAHEGDRKRVLFSGVEHHCVLGCRPTLERLGYQVELIPVDRRGRVRLDALEKMMSDDVLLVAVMHANSEIGTFQPVAGVSRLCRQHGVLFFCDAVQTFMTPDFEECLCADMVAVSAHKVNGPKGVGALRVKAGTKLKPLLVGGGQERELRAGTENVAGIVGFAAAVSARESDQNQRTQAPAKEAFIRTLIHGAPAGLSFTAPPDVRQLASHVHLRFEGIAAESMLIVLDRLGVSASSGAACSAGSLEPSHVLLACGYSETDAAEGLRFTFGRETSSEDAVEAARRVLRAVEQVRG